MKESLTAAQEALAQDLAQAIAQAAHGELLEIARTLVASSDAELFGATEFKIRKLILRVAGKAYERHLGQKKMATSDPA